MRPLCFQLNHNHSCLLSSSHYFVCCLFMLFPYNSKLCVILFLNPLFHRIIISWCHYFYHLSSLMYMYLYILCSTTFFILIPILLLDQTINVWLWVALYINDCCLMLLYTSSPLSVVTVAICTRCRLRYFSLYFLVQQYTDRLITRCCFFLFLVHHTSSMLVMLL
jgi:hypothetical protein